MGGGRGTWPGKLGSEVDARPPALGCAEVQLEAGYAAGRMREVDASLRFEKLPGKLKLT